MAILLCQLALDFVGAQVPGHVSVEKQEEGHRVVDWAAGDLGPWGRGLRGAYEDVGMPRHTGKSVSRQVRAEVQGAMVDGERGIAYSKGSNLVKYPIDGIP